MPSKPHFLRILLLTAAVFLLPLFSACAQATLAYSQPTVVPTGTWPQNIQSASFINGKAPGFAYLGYQPATQAAAPFSILLNDGKGNFTASAFPHVAFSNINKGYALGDTRATGNIDLVHFISGTQVQTVLGAGNGTFTSTLSSPALSTVGLQTPVWTYAALGKLTTSSTAPTFFAEDTANKTLSVIRNDSGSFSTVISTLPLTDGTGPFLVADLNGDNILDILVLSDNHVATPFYGRGDGTFRSAFNFTLPNGVYSMQLADIDGNGRPELFLSDSNGALFFFQNTAAYGLLSTAIPAIGAGNGLTGNGGHLIAAGDLNGDGIPDLITETPIGIGVLLGQRPVTGRTGQMTVALKGIYNGGPGRSSAILADFNGDGVLDLALDSPEGIAILYGNGDGTFFTSPAFSAGQPALDLSLGSFTSSGRLDAVVATGIPQVQFLTGDGAGNFAATASPSPVGAAQTNARRTVFPHLYTGDFDGDSRLDVAITLDGQPPLPPSSDTSPVPDGTTIHFGNGDGTFSAPVQAAPMANSSHYGHSAVGDFNGDGIPDLANFDVSFYATYLGGRVARAGTMPQSVFYADTANDSINVDEDACDLVATGFLNPGSTKHDILMQDDSEFFVYQNNGDNTFSPAANYQTPALLAPAGYVSVNASTSHFPSTGIFPTALKLVDLDGDGYGDAMMLYHNLASDPAHPDPATPNSLYIYWGQGNRNFVSTPTVLTLGRNYYELAMADIDGDGKPDLVLSDGNLVAVLYNLGNRTFGKEQHFLAGQGINLVATGDVNHDGAQDLVVANGGPVLANPVVNGGALPYTYELNTGGITVLLNSIKPHAVTGNLYATPEPSLYGQDFTITGVITQPSGAAAPTGTVAFSVDGASVGTGTANNQATVLLTSPNYKRGTHQLTATYSGDSLYSSINLSGTHVVKGLPSVTTITNLVTPIYYGQEIGYTNGIDAVVAAAPVTIPPPNGVSTDGGFLYIYLDGQLVCSLVQGGVNTTGGPQRCNDANFLGFGAGKHTMVASYQGNDYFEPSDSITYTVVILPDPTVTTLSTALTPSRYGTGLQFTAIVTAPYAVPTGTVQFLEGTTLLGTSAVGPTGTNYAAIATFTTTTLAAGTHSIVASYIPTPIPNQDPPRNFDPSSSGPLAQVIQATSGTVLTSSLNPSTFGQSVTFTAAVALGGTTAVATGTITFTDGTTTLGTVTLNAQGVATYTTSTLAVGQHPITATFTPADPSTALSSASLIQIVIAATTANGNDFTLKVTPSDMSVGVGNTGTVVVTVTPGLNFKEPVTLSCSDLPWEATCTFVTVTIPSGGGSTQLGIHPEAPHNCSDSNQYFVAGTTGRFALALAALAALLFGLRRRRILPALFAFLLCLLPALAGCGLGGHCTDLGTRPGTYTITVNGKSTGTLGITHSQSVHMKAFLDGE